MRRTGFALGYAGGILALVCALLMIYTVPAGLVTSLVQDIGSDLENENIVALGEMLSQDTWPPLSRAAYEDFADEVAGGSRLPLDDETYEQTALFVYRAGLNALVSGIVIAVNIAMALVAFFGSLASRKKPYAGGVMMLVSALLLLIGAIYTRTVMPTAVACMLLAAAGVIAFLPGPEKNAPVRSGYRPYSPPDFPEDEAPPFSKSRVRNRRDNDID